MYRCGAVTAARLVVGSSLIRVSRVLVASRSPLANPVFASDDVRWHVWNVDRALLRRRRFSPDSGGSARELFAGRTDFGRPILWNHGRLLRCFRTGPLVLDALHATIQRLDFVTDNHDVLSTLNRCCPGLCNNNAVDGCLSGPGSIVDMIEVVQ